MHECSRISHITGSSRTRHPPIICIQHACHLMLGMRREKVMERESISLSRKENQGLIRYNDCFFQQLRISDQNDQESVIQDSSLGFLCSNLDGYGINTRCNRLRANATLIPVDSDASVLQTRLLAINTNNVYLPIISGPKMQVHIIACAALASRVQGFVLCWYLHRRPRYHRPPCRNCVTPLTIDAAPAHPNVFLLPRPRR